MDLWTDLSSGADWGLDLLDQPNGLFGDLKETSHLNGDMDVASKPRDAVEQLTYSPKAEDHLGLDWMESGDLGSFLDALDNGQDRLLPLEDSSFDCSREIGLKDNVGFTDGQTKLISINGPVDIFYQGLTPPDSPEQVTPIIKLEPEITDQWALPPQGISSVVPSNNVPTSLNTAIETFPIAVQSNAILDQSSRDEFHTSDLFEQADFIGEASDIFSLTLTSVPANDLDLVDCNDECVNDISDTYSDSGSAVLSPSDIPSPKPSIDSLIQSSPELYKVIATPSDLSARYSPYSKAKNEQRSRGASKSPKSKVVKPSPEPIPEELFPSNLNKKERKKLQNKNAAIRYRQKKKVEVEVIANEVQGLEDRNSELKSKVDDLQREVKYMKSLMEDIYRAKGLVQ